MRIKYLILINYVSLLGIKLNITEVLSNVHKLHGFRDDGMADIVVRCLGDDHKLHCPFFGAPTGNDPWSLRSRYTLQVISNIIWTRFRHLIIIVL